MFVLIDNYDSFTFNLWHYLGELGAEVTVHRNDVVTPEDILALKPQGIVISPGPCDCLGHQCIGQAFGAKVVLAPKPMHGKVSTMTHDGSGVFAGIDSPFTATRYHSLTIDPATVPDCLRVTARSEDDVIQGIAHRDMPIYGVQFHPESIASENGHTLLRNFIGMTGTKAAA